MSTIWNPVIERFETLASTNTTLVEQAVRGAATGTVLVADFQSAGRGRRDRSWEAPPKSSLLCSVLLRPSVALAEAHLVTIAMALAARAAVARATQVTPLLKWPNDLLLGGAKFGGILAEVAAPAPGGDADTLAIVVGLGVNLTFEGPPEATSTSLATATGKTVGRDEFLNLVLEELGERQALLDDETGRTRLLEEYRSVLSTIGLDVRVELAEESLIGRAVSIGSRGELGVDIDGDLRWFNAGDVVHLRPSGDAG